MRTMLRSSRRFREYREKRKLNYTSSRPPRVIGIVRGLQYQQLGIGGAHGAPYRTIGDIAVLAITPRYVA